MRAHKDAPTHWGQRLGHRQHSVLLFRLQWKNLPFDPGVFPMPRKEAARECCASALTKRDRQWIDAHHLCVSAAFLSATWTIHYRKLSYSAGNALPSQAFSFQTPLPPPLAMSWLHFSQPTLSSSGSQFLFRVLWSETFLIYFTLTAVIGVFFGCGGDIQLRETDLFSHKWVWAERRANISYINHMDSSTTANKYSSALPVLCKSLNKPLSTNTVAVLT